MPDIPKVDTTTLHWNPLKSLNETTQRHKLQGIINGMAISGGDNYFKYRWGTSDLVIEGGRHNVHRITATITTPGRSEDQEAYQSKIFVMYNIMLTVEYICSKNNVRNGSITIAYDGIEDLKNPWTPTHNDPVYPTNLI